MQKYIKRLFTLIVLVLVVMIPSNFMYQQTNAYKNENYEITKFMDVPYDIEFANFGSSHGQLGFYYQTPHTYNFALSSQRPDYDLELLESYKDHFAKNAILVFPISYFTPYLFDRTTDSEFASQNLRYYHFLSPDHIIDYKMDIQISEYFSYLSNQDLVKLQYLFKDESLLPELLNRHGNFPVPVWKEQTAQGSDVAAIAKERLDYWNEYRATMDVQKINSYNQNILKDLMKIVEFCEENEFTPVFLTIPVTAAMNERIDSTLYPIFQYDVRTMMKELGNPLYLDYSHDLDYSTNLEYFIDSDHMSYLGAKLFTEKVIQDIKGIVEAS